jgi:hypothetical protein
VWKDIASRRDPTAKEKHASRDLPVEEHDLDAICAAALANCLDDDDDGYMTPPRDGPLSDGGGREAAGHRRAMFRNSTPATRDLARLAWVIDLGRPERALTSCSSVASPPSRREHH